MAQRTTNFDYSKIFIWNNRYDKGEFTNGSGSTVNLLAGTLLGRIHATGKIAVLKSAATDGSQYPIGILSEDYEVADGVTIDVNYCVSGDVAEEKVILDGSDTLETVISARRIRDRIAGDTQGINLVESDELSAQDNQ